MKYHDHLLRGYSVSDSGTTVTLDLLSADGGRASSIRFSGVALYHFTHTGEAIITDIDEVPIAKHIEQIADQLERWNKAIGVSGWTDTWEHYKDRAVTSALRAWTIDSAVGFTGFVIAKSLDSGFVHLQ